MSHAMLYHAFHVQGFRLVKWEFDEHKVLMRVAPQQHKVCCSACGGRNVIRHGESTRWLRNLPIGGDLTWVIVTIPRVECSDCGMTRQIKTGLSKPRVGYTHAFARYVVELCHHMTIQDVAQHLGVSWDVVKGIHKDFLAKRFAKPPLAEVREIAIDEICVGKKRFLTIVLDLATGAILFVGEGKKGDTLLPFWRRVKRNRCRIEAVAVDFGKAYIAAVQRHLPDAVLVFDRFHIVKLFNEKLTQLRRDLFRQATDDLQKKVLKGIRWLLLKNSGHLDDERGERHRLEEALRLNHDLATAYYLKEDLRQFWEQDSKSKARRFLLSWYQRCLASGVRVLQEFARFLLAHQHGLLAWYDHPISTGPLEGTNNKIKTLQRTHYGFRDQQYFFLRLYNLHNSEYKLVG
jgi:transposase